VISKADEMSRVTLVAQELGLGDADIEKFYYVKRNGKRRHFNYIEFAKKHGVSKDWIFDGLLSEHPRNLKREQPRRRRKTNAEAMKERREVHEAIRGRIRDFTAARDLSAEDIKPAMTLKHFELATFAETYSVSVEWLLTGKGRIGQTS
jgi:hypothetical protein